MFDLNRSAVALVAILATVFGAPIAAQADDPPAPTVTTLAATDITGTTATLHAKVATIDPTTTGHFVYGTAPDQLTLRTPDTLFSPGPGEVAMDTPISHLSANTKYYVVAVVENDDWVVTGDLMSFSTLVPPSILSGSVSDITYKSATLHLNVVTGGQPVTVSGSIVRSSRLVSRPRPVNPVLVNSGGSVGTPFGPISVAADGDVVVPLPALEAGTGYTWRAQATGVAGDGTSSGAFRTEALITMPRPTLTPTVATYGSHVMISGTISSKPGLALTLAEQAFPFNGPIAPLAGTAATTDATGAYAFDLRADHPAAYGVTADGAVALAVGNLSKLKVAPAVTAKTKHASHHRFVVAGQYQPAVSAKVSLYRRGAGRVGVVRTSKGTSRFPARALKPGTYEVRVRPAAHTGFSNAKSAAMVVSRR
jgi:hypothetical protein